MKNAPLRLEGPLLLCALLLTVCGVGLTLVGKRAFVLYPDDAVNVNTGGARQWASVTAWRKAQAGLLPALGMSYPPPVAKPPGDPLPPREGVRQALLPPPSLRSPVSERGKGDGGVGLPPYVARTPAQVTRAVAGGLCAFAVLFFVAHVLLRRLSPRTDPLLLPIVCALSGVGLTMALSVHDPWRDTFSFPAQVWGVAVYGLVALLLPQLPAFARLPLRRYAYPAALASGGLMLLLLIAGHGPGGVHLRVFGFEPVEVIKLLLAVFVAGYLAERRGSVGDPVTGRPRLRDFGPLTALYVFVLLLFALVKDLGPAVLLFGMFLAVLWVTTRKFVYPLVGTGLLLLAALAGYAGHFGFFATRVVMWLRPWDNSDPRGAQLADGLWGMATGGVFGSGLGLGQPGVMPRAGSDLIFASIGEETGLIGTLCVLLLYAVLTVRGVRIALAAGTEFDRLLALALTFLLGAQAAIITAGVSGLAPLTGITLPFVSYGTSSLVVSFFVVGLLLHISGKDVPPDPLPPGWERAARAMAGALCAVLLVGVGGRLLWVQGFGAGKLATLALRTPDRDQLLHGKLRQGETPRPHVNPRLQTYANAIPRGRILDRNGVVLARDANANEPGTSLLCPGGRRRTYPLGIPLAQIVTSAEAPHLPSNALGQDATLRGFASYESLLSLYRRRWLPFPAHLHGDDVTLSVDSGLQTAAYMALAKYAPHPGAFVLLNAQTGDVLCAASYPAFDPDTLTLAEWNALHTSADTSHALLNRAVSGLYPPGSAFKIVTAAAGLGHGMARQTYFCPHTGIVSWLDNGTRRRRRVTDEDGFVPHGQTDMGKAVRVSCNVYFAHLGVTMGADALSQTAQSFGFHYLPSPAEWSAALPDCAYGQGAVQVSLLEMARAAGCVANGGELLPASWGNAHGKSVRILSPAVDSQLQAMLAAVTQPGGTAQGVFDGMSVAGKTGSAENGTGAAHSWFAGYAPAVNPTYAFACVIEHGGHGRDAAAPVCRDVLRRAL